MVSITSIMIDRFFFLPFSILHILLDIFRDSYDILVYLIIIYVYKRELIMYNIKKLKKYKSSEPWQKKLKSYKRTRQYTKKYTRKTTTVK